MVIEFPVAVVVVGGVVMAVACVCITTGYVAKKNADKKKMEVINNALSKVSAVVDEGCAALLSEVRALREQASMLEKAAEFAQHAVGPLRDEMRRLLDRRPKIEIKELVMELRPTVSTTLSAMAALVGIYDGFGLKDQLRFATDALAKAFDVADPLAVVQVIEARSLPPLALASK